MPGGNRSHRGASVRCSTHPSRRPGRHDRCHDPPAPGDRSLRARRLPLVERLGPGPRAGRRAQADRHQRGLRPRHQGRPRLHLLRNPCFGSRRTASIPQLHRSRHVGRARLRHDARRQRRGRADGQGHRRGASAGAPAGVMRPGPSRSRSPTRSTPARATSTSSDTTAASTRAPARSTSTTTST